ncbi:hypothetical protein GOV14_03295 [Candidatus Pacearchaeota archaeon]|nr:hypothetical protein [Candidatus Pacearchaeota archaeon]
MSGAIKTVLEAQEYLKLKKWVGIGVVLIIMALIILAAVYLFYLPKTCPDPTNSGCFVASLEKCDKVQWTRQGNEADWTYTVIGKSGKESCKVNVKLEGVREGSSDSESLIKKQMTCIVPKSATQFPEKDISKCSGKLKEDLQDTIIQKMHNYLIENVGEIKKEFSGF